MLKTDCPKRRLHLVDIENLVGSARPTVGQVAACRAAYYDQVGVQPGDLVIVACNHGAALEVGLGWRGARLLLRSGPDGADLALIDVIESESVEDRFPAVVVGSGDGRFADPVASLGARALDVTVVATERALSTRLKLAAKTAVPFDTGAADGNSDAPAPLAA